VCSSDLIPKSNNFKDAHSDRFVHSHGDRFNHSHRHRFVHSNTSRFSNPNTHSIKNTNQDPDVTAAFTHWPSISRTTTGTASLPFISASHLQVTLAFSASHTLLNTQQFFITATFLRSLGLTPSAFFPVSDAFCSSSLLSGNQDGDLTTQNGVGVIVAVFAVLLILIAIIVGLFVLYRRRKVKPIKGEGLSELVLSQTWDLHTMDSEVRPDTLRVTSETGLLDLHTPEDFDELI
jgi:hypothetical protein